MLRPCPRIALWFNMGMQNAITVWTTVVGPSTCGFYGTVVRNGRNPRLRTFPACGRASYSRLAAQGGGTPRAKRKDIVWPSLARRWCAVIALVRLVRGPCIVPSSWGWLIPKIPVETQRKGEEFPNGEITERRRARFNSISRRARTGRA